MGRRFAASAGVDATVAGWSALSEEQVLEQQFAQMSAAGGIHPMAANLASVPTAVCEVTMPWGPALDPATLPTPPHEAWVHGFNVGVRVLVGSTADEFMMPTLAPAPERVLEWLATVPFAPEVEAYAREQLRNGCPDPLGRLATALLFRRNVLRIAAARAQGGAKTWIYDFQHRSSVTGRSGHCLELPFTWDCLGDSHVTTVAGPNQPRELAQAMHAAWVAFVRDGDPGWAEGTGRVFGGEGRHAPYEDVASLA
jgi:para-nitrobenzyl esterase